MKTYLRTAIELLRLINRNANLGAALVLIVSLNFLTLLCDWLILYLLGQLLVDTVNPGLFILDYELPTVVIIPLLILNFVLRISLVEYTARFTKKFSINQTQSFFSRYLHGNIQYVKKIDSSESITQVLYRLNDVAFGSIQNLLALFNALLAFFGIVMICIFYMGIKSLLAFAFPVFVFFIVNMAIIPMIAKTARGLNVNSLQFTSVVEELIYGYLDLRANIAEWAFKDRSDASIEQLREIQKSQSVVTQLPRLSIEFIGFLTIVVLVFLNSNADLNEIAPTLMVVVYSLQRLIPVISTISATISALGAKSDIISAYLHFDRTNKIEELYPTPRVREFTSAAEIEVSKDEKVFFNLKKRQAVKLHGPSGCGKSSLMLELAGLTRDKHYQILFKDKNGQVIQDGYPKITYVPQNPVIFNANLFENITLDSHNTQVRRNLNEEVAYITEELGIFEDLNSRDILSRSTLSGGQILRIALARALIRKPDFILIDETFSGIHPNLAVSILRYIKSEFRVGCLIVSHNAVLDSEFDDIIEWRD